MVLGCLAVPKCPMRLVRFFGEGLAGVALSVLFTFGFFVYLPFAGLFILGLLGSFWTIGLFFVWAFLMLPSLIVGVIFLKTGAKVFGWSTVSTGVIVSVWIQYWLMSGGLGL
jgi:hypothetical protein